MKPTSYRSRLTGLAACLTLLGVAVSGCSSGSVDSAADRHVAAAEEAPAPEREGRIDLYDGGSSSAALSADQAGRDAAPTGGTAGVVRREAVISTGNVALRSTDVAQARFDVQKVVDRYRGEVAEEQTDTDDDGEVRRARQVVRIPTADFAAAMDDLERSADLISSDTTTDDVTTQVIDLGIRVRVQRRSIARVETLLDRATSIGDIIAIESQLSRRQAVLGSLVRQQAYLADQTAMSTITVSVERTEEDVQPRDDDRTGFAAGLAAGWDGLSALAVGLATVAGALLPFAALLLVLLIPAWPLLRRLRRRPTTPAEA